MVSKVTDRDLSRMCTCLQAENKNIRKDILSEILNNAFIREEMWSTEDLFKVWDGVIQPLVRLLNDQTEVCRDYTVEILTKFLNVLPTSDKNIIYVIPILSRRLSPQEYIEQSEEVRLKCIILLKLIISKYKEYLPVYLDDLINILARTVTDNYPNVKKESCECISLIAKTIPKDFYTRSERLVKPILTNFTHQHYKIRAIAVKTIGDLIQYGHSKFVEEVATPLAERLFDQSGAVRAAVVEVAGHWLVALRDRYSWWHKLLPLVMTGLHDEIENIRISASKLWDAAGRLYIEENKEDAKVKDKIDFLDDSLTHYPPKVSRPNLGCRIITQQNLCKLVSGVALELGDWKPDIRIRSAQLLCVLVLNVEQDVTQHIDKLLPAMYRACNDEDNRVVENVEIAAEYIGYFVQPTIYCHLILPTLEESPLTGHLTVFAAILRGSEATTLCTEIEKIANFLQQSHICQSRKSKYQNQILSCCKSLTLVCHKKCIAVTQQLFIVIFTTLAMAIENRIQEEAEMQLNMLVEINELNHIGELYFHCIQPLLKTIENNCESWTIYSAEAHIFWSCLIHASPATANNLDITALILKKTLGDDADPELRLKHFILLSEYFLHGETSFKYIKNLQDFVDMLIKDCLMPGLIWCAGRVSEAIRTAALCCLCTLLENHTIFLTKRDAKSKNVNSTCNQEDNAQGVQLFPNVETFSSIFDTIVPVLITLANDNAKKSRLYSLRAIYLIVTIGCQLFYITDEHIHRIYPIVLKKLDDGCDQVRRASIEALTQVWEAAPKDYDLAFSRSHVDNLYTTMIIHLDDPETEFQDLMLGALIRLAKIYPTLLIQKLQNCKDNFRNREGIEKLLEHSYAISNDPGDIHNK